MAIAGVTIMPESVDRSHLSLNPGDLSGDLIKGGTQKDFSSTGIQDLATTTSLTVKDGGITVTNIDTQSINFNGHPLITFEHGLVRINGQLKADIEQTELKVTDKVVRVASNATETRDLHEAGITIGKDGKLSITFNQFNNSFKFTAGIEIHPDEGIKAGGDILLTAKSLGNKVMFSKLRTVGVLRELEVDTDFKVADDLFYQSDTGYLGLGIEEPAYRVHVDADDVRFMIGTYRGNFALGTLNGGAYRIISNGNQLLQLEPTGLWINPNVGESDSTLRVTHSPKSSAKQTLVVDTVPECDAIIVKDINGTQLKLTDGDLAVKNSISVNGRVITWSDRPPVTGNWTKGSIVYNTEIGPETNLGWVCIESGEPGEWRTFGKID